MPLIDTRVPLIAASCLAQSWSVVATPATAETHRTIAISPYGSTARGRNANARNAGLDSELGDPSRDRRSVGRHIDSSRAPRRDACVDERLADGQPELPIGAGDVSSWSWLAATG